MNRIPYYIPRSAYSTCRPHTLGSAPCACVLRIYEASLNVLPAVWPLQDIRLLRGYCARINHPSIPPPTCMAHPGAILLHDYFTVEDSLPTSRS